MSTEKLDQMCSLSSTSVKMILDNQLQPKRLGGGESLSDRAGA